MRYAFALDFLGDSLRAGFVSEGMEVLGVSKLDFDGFMSDGVAPMEKLVALLQAKMRAAPAPVDAVCFSCDCDLSPDRRSVVNCPKAVWMNGEPVADILERLFGKPVFLERRARIFLNHDRVLLGLPAKAVIIGCYIADSYENAVWCRGAMLAGQSGAAGNIGHMPVHGREDNCQCGKLGCAGLYGSGYRLKQLHSLIFPDTPLEELFAQHADHPLLQEFLRMMAYPIAVEADILDPDCIIIGGAIPSLPNFPLRDLEDMIRGMTYHPYPSRTIALTRSMINDAEPLPYIAAYAFGKSGAAAQ